MDPVTQRRMRTAHLNHRTTCACGRVLHGNGAKSHLRACEKNLNESGWPLADGWITTFVDAGLPGAETARRVQLGLGRWALEHRTPTGRVTQPDSLPWQRFKELIWQLAEPKEP